MIYVPWSWSYSWWIPNSTEQSIGVLSFTGYESFRNFLFLPSYSRQAGWMTSPWHHQYDVIMGHNDVIIENWLLFGFSSARPRFPPHPRYKFFVKWLEMPISQEEKNQKILRDLIAKYEANKRCCDCTAKVTQLRISPKICSSLY